MIINDLVETHCHILPNIDDGSRSIENSIKMIEKLQAQGAKTIILTPHYYSDNISLDDFADRRDNAFNELKSALPYGSPNLILAAETYISKYLFHNDDLSRITFGKENYILIEHPFETSFSERSYNRILDLKSNFGVTPILAHIERYKPLMDDEEILDDFINIGCLVQVNIESFSSASKGIRKKLIKYLKEEKIHLIGSDAHNMTSRPPLYENGAKEIISNCGRLALDRLINNANEIIK